MKVSSTHKYPDSLLRSICLNLLQGCSSGAVDIPLICCEVIARWIFVSHWRLLASCGRWFQTNESTIALCLDGCRWLTSRLKIYGPTSPSSGLLIVSALVFWCGNAELPWFSSASGKWKVDIQVNSSASLCIFPQKRESVDRNMLCKLARMHGFSLPLQLFLIHCVTTQIEWFCTLLRKK